MVEVEGDIAAMEAKYVGKWSTSPYNPAQEPRYPGGANIDKMVDQALKYDDKYPGGVLWVTNSSEFIAEYTKRFKDAGVKNFSFVLIPALEERKYGPNPD